MRRFAALAALCLITGFLFTAAFAVTTAGTADSAGENAALNEAKWGGGEALHIEEFTADHYLKGLYSNIVEYFHTGLWEIKAARLVLSVSTTQLMRAPVSDITVYLNDRPVYSGALPATNGEIVELAVELPASDVKVDSVNAINVSAYMRANDDDPCVDYASSANWVNIFCESRVEVAYAKLYKPDSIASVYAQLSSIDALGQKQSGIYVSGGSKGALTAAAWASMGLAQNAVLNYTNMYSGGAKLPNKPYALYISDADSLFPEIRGLLSAEQLKAANSGAIAAVLRYNDSDVLLVAGKNAEALANAGRMLANEKYMGQLRTKYKKITENDDFSMDKYRVEQYTALTSAGQYVNGSYRQTASFYIDWPANRAVASSSELSLDIRYSKNINFTRSLVSVYVEDIPIGSSQLTEAGADGMNLTVAFPKDAELKGSFTIKVAFDLEALDDWCRLTQEEMPWGYIAPTSMLKLDGVDVSSLEFGDYPSPFVRDGSVNGLVFVLPDEPNEAELAALHSVSAGLGRFLKDNRGDLRAVAQKDAGELAGNNVIYIGAAGRNAASGALAWPLDFAGTQLASASEKLKIDAGYGSALGVCELLASPEDGAYSLMLLSGSTDTELLMAAKHIEDTDMLWKLSGDAFIVSRHDDDANCYEFAERQKMAKKSETVQAQAREVVNVLLVAGLAAAICVAALVMFIIRARRR